MPLIFEETNRGDLHVARNLRWEDAAEVVLATGKDPETALMHREYLPGARTFTIRAPGSEHPMAIFGAVPFQNHLREHVGQAWFLATAEIEEHSLSLLKEIPAYIDELSAPYDAGLMAFMWEGNKMHRRWAEAVGFHVDPDGELWLQGVKFHRLFRPT